MTDDPFVTPDTAAKRMEKGRPGVPLTPAEQAFFGVLDEDAKPPTNARSRLGEHLSVSAVRVSLRNTNLTEKEIDGVILNAGLITPDDMRVEPHVRGRLHDVLLHDDRFNGTYSTGMGYSEFITRALDALDCKK